MITLAGISLTSDLLWADEYDWTTISQQEDIMSDGSVVVQADAQQTGRPITLLGGDTFGYVAKSVVDSISTLANNPGLEMELILNDGSTHNVIFTENRFTAEQACDNNNPSADFLYFISLFLMEL